MNTDARYIGHIGGGSCEIGIIVMSKDAKEDAVLVQTRHHQDDDGRYQIVSVIDVAKAPADEQAEFELGKKLELAGYGLWRDLKDIADKNQWECMGQYEFQEHYSGEALDEIKRVLKNK